MKERPILFSGPMVREILAGRKTQTRRVMRTQPLWVADPSVPFKTPDADPKGIINCPFGAPGDRLWVRETFRLYDCQTECACYDSCSCSSHHGKPVFRATHPDDEGPWSPSIHMPRWACRIILEVAGVRVERLNEISEEDAKSEWCSPLSERCRRTPVCGSDDWPEFHGTHRDNFRCWWGSIYGPEDWAENPWVWVVEFKVIEGGAA